MFSSFVFVASPMEEDEEEEEEEGEDILPSPKINEIPVSKLRF